MARFLELLDKADKAVDQNAFYCAAGDWANVEGDPEGEGNARWIANVTRGQVFKQTPGGAAGIVGAEILYYVGPYMLNAHRDDDSHFVVAAGTMGKLFQSDDDEGLCDGAQLASDIADGLRESAWPALLMQTSSGPDDVADVDARGGQRIADLRGRVAYLEARLTSSGGATKIVARLLPQAMRRTTIVPCLAAVFTGISSGSTIAEGISMTSRPRSAWARPSRSTTGLSPPSSVSSSRSSASSPAHSSRA